MNNKFRRDPKKLQELKDYFNRNPHAIERFMWTEEELMEDLSSEKHGPVIPIDVVDLEKKVAEIKKNFEYNVDKEEGIALQEKIKKQDEETRRRLGWD